EMPPHFVTSSTEATGKEDLLAYIDSINEEVFKNNSTF
ncbi:YihA family ribosome biogenesis GTP-binding protein, partial [Streptococcus pyogenes]